MKAGLIAFTAKGQTLLQRVANALSCTECHIYDKTETDTGTWIEREFASGDALFFVSAAGIAVRIIAPLLRGKDRDPAVLVLDKAGRFVVPLI